MATNSNRLLSSSLDHMTHCQTCYHGEVIKPGLDSGLDSGMHAN